MFILLANTMTSYFHLWLQLLCIIQLFWCGVLPFFFRIQMVAKSSVDAGRWDVDSFERSGVIIDLG